MPRRLQAGLELKASEGLSDVRDFFDREAAGYEEAHGDARRLLSGRVAILRRLARFSPSDTVVEIGCGPGQHLLALTDAFRRGVGVDISQRMIERARAGVAEGPRGNVSFHVDSAEALETLADASADCVFCVGALEHMVHQQAVVASAFRVLAPVDVSCS